MSDIFEPWQPREGQRVRVRLSSECRSSTGFMDHEDDDGSGGHLDARCHDPAEDGQAGTIHQIEPPDPYDVHDPTYYAHRFLVMFDREVTVAATTYPQSCQYYAASELEPSSEEAP